MVGAFKKKGRHYDKTFTTGLRPIENRPTALAGVEMQPPLVAGATTFPPAEPGALWVLSIVHMSLRVNIERFILPPE